MSIEDFILKVISRRNILIAIFLSKDMKKSALIVLRNGKKLLLYLRDNKPDIPHPAHWALFGGAIEEGENPSEALMRELNEEIDCAVSHIEFVDTIHISNHPRYPDETIYLFRGKVSEDAEKIHLFEGQKLGYFTLDELQQLPMADILLHYIIQNKSIFIPQDET